MTLSNDNYNEAIKTHSSASGTITIDLQEANVHRVEAIDNITFEFVNVSQNPAGNSLLIYVVDSDGAGPYTFTWPASIIWSDGSVISEVSQNSNIEVGLLTDDGGTEWRGRESGGGFS